MLRFRTVPILISMAVICWACRPSIPEKKEVCQQQIAVSLAATTNARIYCSDGIEVVTFEKTLDFVRATAGAEAAYLAAHRPYDLGIRIVIAEPSRSGRPVRKIVSNPENLRLGPPEAPFGFMGPRPVIDRFAIDGPYLLAAASKLDPIWFDPEVNAFYGNKNLPGCTVTFEVDDRVAEIIVPCDVMGPLSRRIVTDARRGLRAWAAPALGQNAAGDMSTKR